MLGQTAAYRPAELRFVHPSELHWRRSAIVYVLPAASLHYRPYGAVSSADEVGVYLFISVTIHYAAAANRHRHPRRAEYRCGTNSRTASRHTSRDPAGQTRPNTRDKTKAPAVSRTGLSLNRNCSTSDLKRFHVSEMIASPSLLDSPRRAVPAMSQDRAATSRRRRESGIGPRMAARALEPAVRLTH